MLQAINLIEKYNSNIEEVDAIFETSLALKSIYESAFAKKIEDKDTTYLAKQKLSHKLSMLSNIETQSIENAESGAWARLYPQAVIITISIAEQLIKDAFETLIENNLEQISNLDEKTFKFGDIRDKTFKLERQDWVDLVLKSIYGDSNPTEKVNFQNIKAIQGIFKNYFNIDINISPELEREIHFFYQVRHILIHNGGKIDERFIKNIKKAGYSKHFNNGEKIQIGQEEYARCKNVFLKFFENLNKSFKAVS